MSADIEITNSENMIDSRNIDARIDWLIENREEFREDNNLSEYPGFENYDESKWEEWDSEYGAELHSLETLKNACDGGEWQYGVTLVKENCFTEYAREFAEEIGDVSRDARWPHNHIDWEAAADELKQDYSEVDFDGVTFLYRE